MQQNRNENLKESHDLPPQDEATKEKISKHLSDIDDTISEEDIKNINTDTGAATPGNENRHDIDEANEILNEKPKDDDKPEEEAPTSWEILGE